MRILDIDNNVIINNVEIELTHYELEEFLERLNDLTFNPDYNLSEVINDTIIGSSNDLENNTYTIELSIFNDSNLSCYPKEIQSLIKKDKI
jgi:hypothetical protein